MLMTLWRALLSATVEPEYHAEMQYSSTLSISSFVFVVFRDRLLSEHHTSSFCNSSLSADSSSPEISPITVVSSANLMMVLVGWVGVQSYVYKE